VLLLAKSFSEISSTFVNLATNPTDFLMAMTSSFKSYCLQKANKINHVKNEHTLEFFLGYQDDTFTTSCFLSSLEEKRETGNLPKIILDKAVATKGEGGLVRK
jgi:hypothetical protein